MTTRKSGDRSPGFLIRAAQVNQDLIDAEIRECQRREDELRQQMLTAATAATPASPSATADAVPNTGSAPADWVPDRQHGLDERRGPSQYSAASTMSTTVVRPSGSLERRVRQTMSASEATSPSKRRCASLRLRYEMLEEERQRQSELVQQGLSTPRPTSSTM